MPRAAQTFHAVDPVTRRSVVYRGPGVHRGEVRELGDEVPLEVAAKVRDHVLSWEEGEERPAPAVADTDGAFDGDAFDQAVQTKVDEVLAVEVEKAIDEHRDKEAAVLEALTSSGDAFDPTADKVTAQQVKDHLTALDTTTAVGRWEYDRVVEAEKAGPNRSSAIPF